MQTLAVADVVHDGGQAVEDEALAARCGATTILITAVCAADVENLAHLVTNDGARDVRRLRHGGFEPTPRRPR